MGSWLGRRGRGGRGRWRWRWRRWRGGGGGSWLLWCGGFEEGGFFFGSDEGGREREGFMDLARGRKYVLFEQVLTYVRTYLGSLLKLSHAESGDATSASP